MAKDLRFCGLGTLAVKNAGRRSQPVEGEKTAPEMPYFIESHFRVVSSFRE